MGVVGVGVKKGGKEGTGGRISRQLFFVKSQ